MIINLLENMENSSHIESDQIILGHKIHEY